MIVRITGNIKPYYVQTLCMLFFPGETFAPDEPDDGRPVLTLDVRYGKNTVAASAEIRAEGKSASESAEDDFDHSHTREKTVSLCVGKLLYRLLGGVTGFYPAWGILTGVRPSKLPMTVLRGGGTVEEAAAALERDYLVSRGKAMLASQTACAELDAINSLPEKSCSVYVSIPFCPTRCAYCSFVSYSTKRLLSMIGDYLERLYSDLGALFDAIGNLGMRVVSVYIGGGTPAILDERQTAGLFRHINAGLDRAGRGYLRELTFEGGRPDAVTPEKLRAAYEGGATRISVNPQTTDDGVLAAIGRSHTADDFFKAYNIAAKSGIKYINTDLIAGLPGDTADSFEKSVGDIVSLHPSNVTVHSFSVKKSSQFRENGGSIYSRGGGIAPYCVDYARERLCGDGYHPYYIYRQKNTVGSLENVGYTMPGADGLYNIFIMEEVHDIFAAGAGAVTKLVRNDAASEDGVRIARLFEPKYPYEYLESGGNGGTISGIYDFYGVR